MKVGAIISRYGEWGSGDRWQDGRTGLPPGAGSHKRLLRPWI